MRAGRFTILAIGLSVFVAAGVMLRREDAGEAPSVGQPQARSHRPASAGPLSSEHAARPRERRTPIGMAVEPDATTSPDSSPRSAQSRGQAQTAVIGSRVGSGGSDEGAQRRDQVVRKLPARSAEAVHPDAEDSWRDGLPVGTRFAAPLRGTVTSADGSQPLVDKNVEPDGNDGLYFPGNAELAYPDRAGVQNEAGTIALWVEPVDWAGQDASVHSFFRLNDPAEAGYRFHLLKDASSLRFQFITEVGETNLRVPIDWWPRGEGHHVAATWDSNILRLYVDGTPLAEQPYEGTLRVPANAPGWWGSNLQSGTQGAGAVLKNTLVADRPLPDSEIQALSQPN